MTKYAIIIAVDEEGGFSKDNQLPWYFPDDLKHFQKVTNGQVCVMGRKTYEDINRRLGPKANDDVLPNRTSVVLSSSLVAQNCLVVRSKEALLNFIGTEQRMVFFIGGKSIFDLGLEIADELYLTNVPGKYNCDLFFPLQEVWEKFEIVLNTTTENGLQFIQAKRK